MEFLKILLVFENLKKDGRKKQRELILIGIVNLKKRLVKRDMS